jgi:hypothetical protein
MITVIRDLVDFLSQDPLTIKDVIAHVGTVVHEPGGLMAAELRPALPGLHSAFLTRYPDSDFPYTLELNPVPESCPTVEALTAVFGDYHRSRTDYNRPPVLSFYPSAIGSHWRIVVIAKLKLQTDRFDNALVTSVVLRRDPA